MASTLGFRHEQHIRLHQAQGSQTLQAHSAKQRGAGDQALSAESRGGGSSCSPMRLPYSPSGALDSTWRDESPYARLRVDDVASCAPCLSPCDALPPSTGSRCYSPSTGSGCYSSSCFQDASSFSGHLPPDMFSRGHVEDYDWRIAASQPLEASSFPQTIQPRRLQKSTSLLAMNDVSARLIDTHIADSAPEPVGPTRGGGLSARPRRVPASKSQPLDASHLPKTLRARGLVADLDASHLPNTLRARGLVAGLDAERHREAEASSAPQPHMQDTISPLSRSGGRRFPTGFFDDALESPSAHAGCTPSPLRKAQPQPLHTQRQQPGRFLAKSKSSSEKAPGEGEALGRPRLHSNRGSSGSGRGRGSSSGSDRMKVKVTGTMTCPPPPSPVRQVKDPLPRGTGGGGGKGGSTVKQQWLSYQKGASSWVEGRKGKAQVPRPWGGRLRGLSMPFVGPTGTLSRAAHSRHASYHGEKKQSAGARSGESLHNGFGLPAQKALFCRSSQAFLESVSMSQW